MRPRLRPCLCSGRYTGCDHPTGCRTPAGRTGYCQPCADHRAAHVAAGIDTIARRRPQDDLAHYQRSNP